MKLPVDDFMLLSLVNTALRDNFDDLDALCEDWDVEKAALCARLAIIGYEYDGKRNAFSAK